MKLILVRHGQTIENVKGIIQGQNPGHLSEIGKEQAKKLGKRLKDEKIDVIFCSDLKRTRDTADEIIKFHSVPVHYVKELREVNTGEYTGKSVSEWNAIKHDPEHRKSRGAETLVDMFNRSKDLTLI